MPTWDPDQYLRFADHRLRPAADLVARIPLSGPELIWDLGCGTGGPTLLLRRRWPEATINALDSSAEMLEQAPPTEGIDWIRGDIAEWSPAEPPSLVFSNAALHWVDDHVALFPRLVGTLRPGGVLAVQMPRNHEEPSHVRLRETARSDRWRDRVAHLVREAPVLAPQRYHGILREHSASIDLWETVYLQALIGRNAVAEWARGSVLRPFLDVLGNEGDAFFADYASRLADDHPAEPDGTTLFPFRRLFIVATREGGRQGRGG
ncbi:MAG: methyltransferase domain-containing protein [Acidimicrobiia bacterium]|nr:methyltransferase domain-containing protein [Acidimicrobiia bacterium]